MKKAHPFVLFAGKTGRRMNIKIVGRKVNLRENFKELVQRKLSKFDRIFDEDADATVTVTLEKNRQTVEIMIKQRGMLYRAEATAPEMNEALDDVVAALGNQIRRNKKRLERAQKMQPVELPDTYYDTPDEEDEPEIAKRKTFYVKVMTVEEAICRWKCWATRSSCTVTATPARLTWCISAATASTACWSRKAD